MNRFIAVTSQQMDRAMDNVHAYRTFAPESNEKKMIVWQAEESFGHKQTANG